MFVSVSFIATLIWFVTMLLVYKNFKKNGDKFYCRKSMQAADEKLISMNWGLMKTRTKAIQYLLTTLSGHINKQFDKPLVNMYKRSTSGALLCGVLATNWMSSNSDGLSLTGPTFSIYSSSVHQYKMTKIYKKYIHILNHTTMSYNAMMVVW